MKHFGGLFIILGVVACGGGAKGGGTTVSNTNTAAGGLPPAYAALFTAKEVSFPAELVESGVDDGGPNPRTTKGTVKCVLSNPHAQAGGTAIDLACTSELDLAGALDGTYIGSATGLWHGDASLATLDPNAMLLAATPVEGMREQKNPENGDAGVGYNVKANGKDWCATIAGWGGDEAGITLCLRDGTGLVGGYSYWAGGSTKELYFGDVPHDTVAD